MQKSIIYESDLYGFLSSCSMNYGEIAQFLKYEVVDTGKKKKHRAIKVQIIFRSAVILTPTGVA